MLSPRESKLRDDSASSYYASTPQPHLSSQGGAIFSKHADTFLTTTMAPQPQQQQPTSPSGMLQAGGGILPSQTPPHTLPSASGSLSISGGSAANGSDSGTPHSVTPPSPPVPSPDPSTLAAAAAAVEHVMAQKLAQQQQQQQIQQQVEHQRQVAAFSQALLEAKAMQGAGLPTSPTAGMPSPPAAPGSSVDGSAGFGFQQAPTAGTMASMYGLTQPLTAASVAPSNFEMQSPYATAGGSTVTDGSSSFAPLATTTTTAAVMQAAAAAQLQHAAATASPALPPPATAPSAVTVLQQQLQQVAPVQQQLDQTASSARQLAGQAAAAYQAAATEAATTTDYGHAQHATATAQHALNVYNTATSQAAAAELQSAQLQNATATAVSAAAALQSAVAGNASVVQQQYSVALPSSLPLAAQIASGVMLAPSLTSSSGLVPPQIPNATTLPPTLPSILTPSSLGLSLTPSSALSGVTATSSGIGSLKSGLCASTLPGLIPPPLASEFTAATSLPSLATTSTLTQYPSTSTVTTAASKGTSVSNAATTGPLSGITGGSSSGMVLSGLPSGYGLTVSAPTPSVSIMPNAANMVSVLPQQAALPGILPSSNIGYTATQSLKPVGNVAAEPSAGVLGGQAPLLQNLGQALQQQQAHQNRYISQSSGGTSNGTAGGTAGSTFGTVTKNGLDDIMLHQQQQQHCQNQQQQQQLLQYYLLHYPQLLQYLQPDQIADIIQQQHQQQHLSAMPSQVQPAVQVQPSLRNTGSGIASGIGMTMPGTAAAVVVPNAQPSIDPLATITTATGASASPFIHGAQSTAPLAPGSASVVVNAPSFMKVVCSSGGSFIRQSSTGLWDYEGGETRLVNIPYACSAQDLYSALEYSTGPSSTSESTGGVAPQSTRIKYRLPSDPSVWVDVVDDDDVALMFDEWEESMKTNMTGTASHNHSTTTTAAGVRGRLHLYVQWRTMHDVSSEDLQLLEASQPSGPNQEQEDQDNERNEVIEDVSAVAEAYREQKQEDALVEELKGLDTNGTGKELVTAASGSRGGGGEAYTEGLKTKQRRESGSSSLDFSGLVERMEIIDVSDVQLVRFLGSGGYGDVYLGRWHACEVAVKCLNPSLFYQGEAGSINKQAVLDLIREADILGSLRHPNVVWVYGLVLPNLEEAQRQREERDLASGTTTKDDGSNKGSGAIWGSDIVDAIQAGAGAPTMMPGILRPPALVTEYMAGGSLKNALNRKSDIVAGPLTRIVLALDAAKGMDYLHSKSIVHFDLKSGNLLLGYRDRRPVCKVADFGLARKKAQTFVSGVSSQRGTLPWTAPEIVRTPEAVTEKVDVFSFGIVMWELWSGKEPYEELNYHTLIMQLSNPQIRLRPPVPGTPEWQDSATSTSTPSNDVGVVEPPPPELAPGYSDLMQRCWAEDPADRPTFTEIIRELRGMVQAIKPVKNRGGGGSSTKLHQ